MLKFRQQNHLVKFMHVKSMWSFWPVAFWHKGLQSKQAVAAGQLVMQDPTYQNTDPVRLDFGCWTYLVHVNVK